ncbi:hypothetical protein [Gracilimonas sp.]|uniref:hypothetical protein n=1 Tax=Gracilimonas sp. TaxID=1974203 RepID=UPI0032ED8258
MDLKKVLLFSSGLISLLLSAYNFAVNDTLPNLIVSQVNNIDSISIFETNSLYLIVHGIVLGSISPFIFDRRVNFYRQYKSLLFATVSVGSIFILWDN